MTVTYNAYVNIQFCTMCHKKRLEPHFECVVQPLIFVTERRSDPSFLSFCHWKTPIFVCDACHSKTPWSEALDGTNTSMSYSILPSVTWFCSCFFHPLPHVPLHAPNRRLHIKITIFRVPSLRLAAE